MISSPSVTENIATARRLVTQAADQGASLVLLPEYWAIMGLSDSDKVAVAEPLGQGPIQDFMSSLARELEIWLIGGTLPLASDDPEKVVNTTLVYNARGEHVGRYDKIHLFGFTKGTESYNESKTIVPGKNVGVVEAPFGKVGMSVCYDLRRPRSPTPPARRTGKSCCARAPSKTSAMCWRRRRAAPIRTAAAPGATAC
jgi:nitrilase